MRRARLGIGLVIAATALGAGCHRRPARCAPGSAASVEVRDGAGALLLAWKGADLCDGDGRLVGGLERSGGTVTLRDAAGVTRLELGPESAGSANSAHARGPGRDLRLFRGDARLGLRLLRADGTPLGAVVAGDGGATVYDAAQTPIARVEARDRDAVVRALDGEVRAYVVPARALPAAGAFALPGIDRAEQLSLYAFWSQP